MLRPPSTNAMQFDFNDWLKRKRMRKWQVASTQKELSSRFFRTFFRRVSDGQYDVADGDDLWNLLLIISLNKLRKEATKQRTAKRDINKTHSLIEKDHEKEGSNDDEAFIVLKLTVEEILSTLSAAEREIVEMRIAGHEINQIVESSKRAKRSVERILQSFRRRLKGAIEGE